MLSHGPPKIHTGELSTCVSLLTLVCRAVSCSTDLWPCYPPCYLMPIHWFLLQSSCSALLLQLHGLVTTLPRSGSEKVFVCVCVRHCGLGWAALAVISVMAARSLAKPLTSTAHNELITQTFIAARCVGVLSNQTKLGFLDSALNFKNSSCKHTNTSSIRFKWTLIPWLLTGSWSKRHVNSEISPPSLSKETSVYFAFFLFL